MKTKRNKMLKNKRKHSKSKKKFGIEHGHRNICSDLNISFIKYGISNGITA